jgi:erythronate-4-phosphate dehydrogenase
VELLKMVDIGTPHIAGYSLDGKINGLIMIYRSVCEYFGLEPKFDIEDFLPEPSVPLVKVNAHAGGDQDALATAVREVYRIDQDDERLRRVVDEPAERRGAYFDRLRKNYPVRREFQNTEAILATESTEKNMKRLLNKLEGIGFKVQNEKST